MTTLKERELAEQELAAKVRDIIADTPMVWPHECVEHGRANGECEDDCELMSVASYPVAVVVAVEHVLADGEGTTGVGVFVPAGQLPSTSRGLAGFAEQCFRL